MLKNCDAQKAISKLPCNISDYEFSDIHILQGSEATYLKCDWIDKDEFVANLPLCLLVKEF